MFKARYTIAELEEHRKEWVVALRSGQYKQGKSNLKTLTDNYCCLGVACEVAGLKGEVLEPSMHDRAYSFFDSKSGIYMHSALPLTVTEYYGFNSSVGHYKDYLKNSNSLANHNDFDEMDFNQIADIVENNWNVVFTNSTASDYKEEV